jgi:hypothetical protein
MRQKIKKLWCEEEAKKFFPEDLVLFYLQAIAKLVTVEQEVSYISSVQ